MGHIRGTNSCRTKSSVAYVISTIYMLSLCLHIQYSLKDSENIETTGMVLKCALEVPRIFYRSVHIKILYSSKIYIILSYLIFLLKTVVESKLRSKYRQLLVPSTAMQVFSHWFSLSCKCCDDVVQVDILNNITHNNIDNVIILYLLGYFDC